LENIINIDFFFKKKRKHQDQQTYLNITVYWNNRKIYIYRLYFFHFKEEYCLLRVHPYWFDSDRPADFIPILSDPIPIIPMLALWKNNIRFLIRNIFRTNCCLENCERPDIHTLGICLEIIRVFFFSGICHFGSMIIFKNNIDEVNYLQPLKLYHR